MSLKVTRTVSLSSGKYFGLQSVNLCVLVGDELVESVYFSHRGSILLQFIAGYLIFSSKVSHLALVGIG